MDAVTKPTESFRPVTISETTRSYPLDLTILRLSFGGGLRIANLLFFPVIFAVLAFFVDRALVQRVNAENHKKVQIARALPHLLYGLVTCVIFVPDWIRAGAFRSAASILIVFYAKLAISAFYTSITTHALHWLHMRAVTKEE